MKLPFLRLVLPLLGALLFLAALGFAIKNAEPVTVRYYLGAAWQAPLVVVLFVVFVLGAVAGVVASFSYALRLRRELIALKRELRRRVGSGAES